MVEFEIEKKAYRFQENDYLNAGGTEGIIYDIKNNRVAKILRKTNTNKISKILALCNKAEQLGTLKGFENIAIPQAPAYNTHQEVCGFAMTHFKNCLPINEMRYDLFNTSYPNKHTNDKSVIQVIERLFYSLQLLHQNKIIIGDLNAENILWDTTSNKVYYIDLDSSQVGGINNESDDNYYAELYKEEYVCPQVLKLGKNSQGGLPFSTASDIYSLSVVCFEILIGTYPYEVGTQPILSNTEKKEQQISFVDFHFKNIKTYQGVHLTDLFLYDAVKKRLDHIQRVYPELYHHFVHVFHQGKRSYYSRRKLVKNNRKKQKLITIKAIRTPGYNRKEKDPENLNAFLQTFNLKIPHYAF